MARKPKPAKAAQISGDSGPSRKRRRPGGRPFRKGQSGNPAGRPAGLPNKVTVEAREAAAQMVDDPEYRDALKGRLIAGKLAPAIETMLWYYAKGKPKETIALEGGASPVKVDLSSLSLDEVLALRTLVDKAAATTAPPEAAQA